MVRKLQQAIERVEDWALEWGFRFSVPKTKVVFFIRKRIGNDIKLKIYGEDLERVDYFKYLRVYFDKSITLKFHIEKIVEKCKKILNIMRCSVIDYGYIIYGSASKTFLSNLDTIQHQALRLCCGAVKTIPIPALQVKMEEMLLEMRQFQMTYWANLKGHDVNHPNQKLLEPCQEMEN